MEISVTTFCLRKHSPPYGHLLSSAPVSGGSCAVVKSQRDVLHILNFSSSVITPKSLKGLFSLICMVQNSQLSLITALNLQQKYQKFRYCVKADHSLVCNRGKRKLYRHDSSFTFPTFPFALSLEKPARSTISNFHNESHLSLSSRTAQGYCLR